jgi:hypothetical protein
MDEAQLEAFKARATGGGMLMQILVASAIKAKDIQRQMNFGTVMLDMDYSLTPSIKMCFLKEVIARSDVEAYYFACR